jgi:acetamidase/formamidase
VSFKVNEVTSWQITEKSKADVIPKIDHDKIYPLAGPVEVLGARPGDALVVDVMKATPANWGWSAIMPGDGILEEFDEPYLHIWDLHDRTKAPFKNGISIPLRPFCGVYGVAPKGRGYFEVMPPGPHGGNMDNRHLTAGSRLMIPVWTEGALFSLGDLHAAQGDGEVCVTAVECPGEVTVRLDLVKSAKLSTPQYVVPDDRRSRGGFYGTTGIGPDLWEAAKQSVREMIKHLCKEYHLTREDAYLLCSVAADLRIHEMVDKPNWVVGTMIPLDIFPARGK